VKKFNLAALAATAMIALASPAAATDFSFVGTLANDDQVLFFDFTVGAPSSVTLRTYSYAGGVNAAGAVIARGGFDPILSLYSLATGVKLYSNDDGGSALAPEDSVSGEAWDTFLLVAGLPAGSYRVAVSEYDNAGPGSLSGVFNGSSSVGFSDVSQVLNNPRDGHWAFDILNVRSASQVGVPEPATWGLMIGGLGLAGAMLRRRRQGVTTA
jgi:hypothetical protein